MYLLIRLIPRDEAARQGGDLMRIQIIKGTWKTEQSPYQIGHRPSCKKGPRLDRGESGSGRSTLPLNISSVTRSSSAVSIRQAARPFSWTTPSESMWPSFLRTRERFLNSSRNFCSCARRRSTLALEEVEDDKRTPMRAHSGGMSKSSQRMIPGIPASSTWVAVSRDWHRLFFGTTWTAAHFAPSAAKGKNRRRRQVQSNSTERSHLEMVQRTVVKNRQGTRWINWIAHADCPLYRLKTTFKQSCSTRNIEVDVELTGKLQLQWWTSGWRLHDICQDW